MRLAAAAWLVALVGGACTGENLFTGLATSTQLLGPSVDITAPQAGLSIAAGDSVQVTATISAPDGAREVNFTGLFDAGGVAFVGEILALSNPTDTTVTNFLNQVEPPGTGNVSIIVEATDALGARGADTVSVSIN